MLLRELIPLCAHRHHLGGGEHGRAIAGWSMGGYGALLAAETQPRLFAAVVATGPAVWTSYDAMMLGPRDAFDSAADFAEFDVIAHAQRLAGVTYDRLRHGRSVLRLRVVPQESAAGRILSALRQGRARLPLLRSSRAGPGAVHWAGARLTVSISAASSRRGRAGRAPPPPRGPARRSTHPAQSAGLRPPSSTGSSRVPRVFPCRRLMPRSVFNSARAGTERCRHGFRPGDAGKVMRLDGVGTCCSRPPTPT